MSTDNALLNEVKETYPGLNERFSDAEIDRMIKILKNELYPYLRNKYSRFIELNPELILIEPTLKVFILAGMDEINKGDIDGFEFLEEEVPHG